MKNTDDEKEKKGSKNSNTTATEFTRDSSMSVPNRKFEELGLKIENLTKQKEDRIKNFIIINS